MPITCQFKPDESLVVFAHVGMVSDEEFLTRYEACFEDPGFDSSFDILVDLRQTNSSPRGTTVLSKMADYMRDKYENVERGPKAAILAPELLSFGLARMFEVFSEDVTIDVKVFRTVDEAVDWLGKSGNPFD